MVKRLLLLLLLFQIGYSGTKHYRDAAGVVLSLTDAKGEVIASKDEHSVVIDNLVPKTPYIFHIRARFADGTWGPRATTQSETLADGMDVVFDFLLFVFVDCSMLQSYLQSIDIGLGCQPKSAQATIMGAGIVMEDRCI